jgi:polyisoprenoid-binding protein YceI
MKRSRLLWSLTALALLASASIASAATTEFKIDPNHSIVGFSIRHFFSRVQGRFKDFSGTIQFDDKNPASSSVDVTIQASSITTENDRRDGDLRSPNFFSVDSFPTITFKSTKVTPAGENAFKVDGDFTMHGVTKPVTLDVSFLGMGKVSMGGRMGRTIAGFEGKTTLNRKDYGIIWNQTLDQGGTMLGDDVAIAITIESGHSDAPPSGAAPVGQAAPTKK